jgi:hypothetical protein
LPGAGLPLHRLSALRSRPVQVSTGLPRRPPLRSARSGATGTSAALPAETMGPAACASAAFESGRSRCADSDRFSRHGPAMLHGGTDGRR